MTSKTVDNLKIHVILLFFFENDTLYPSEIVFFLQLMVGKVVVDFIKAINSYKDSFNNISSAVFI